MEQDLNYQHSICKITCGKKKGTGFVIGNKTILTVNHVIIDAHKKKDNISLIFLNNRKEEYTTNILAFDNELDIAILETEQSINVKPLNLLKSPIFCDKIWHSFGFPETETGQLSGDSLKGNIKCPIIHHIETIHDTDLYCEPFSHEYIYEGFSGSPIFDEKSNVIAILRRKLTNSLGAISISKLYCFLKKNNIDIEIDYKKYDTQPLSKNWFAEHSDKIITNAGPRYTYFANVKLDYDQYFDAIARNNAFYVRIFKLFGTIKKQADKIYFREDPNELKEKIEKALFPLFIETEKVSKLAKDKEIAWGNIKNVSDQSFNEINKIYFELIDINDKNKPKEKYSGGKYDIQLHELRTLINLINQITSFSESVQAKLSNTPFLIIKGEAGTGKTHLLCDIAVNRIANGQETIMLFGQHFNTSEPWQQIISILGLSISKTEFLERLNDIGKKNEKKCLIFIDALNEGAGKELWKSHIYSVLSDIKKYPWLGMVISIRMPFDKVITNQLVEEKKILEIQHFGFKGNEYKAVREFFKYYKIELFSIPLLDKEFSNPLFLKTFCQAFAQKGYHRLPKGAQKFSFVFNLFIEQKNIIISEKIDVDPKLKILHNVLNKFSETFIKDDLKSITRSNAHIICEKIINSRTWSNSLLFHMISEGVLFESMAFNEKENEWIDTIDFAYERFRDFLKANYLLEFFKEVKVQEDFIQIIFKEENLWYNETLIQALSIILPERIDKEVYEYFPGIKKNEIIVRSFFESLIWRSYKSLDKTKIIEYEKLLFESNVDYYSNFLQVLLTVASDPFHLYNADFLHEKLWKMSMIERDKNWTIPIFEWYKDNSIIDSYIDWAWSNEDKKHIEDKSLLLTSTIIVWFLTSSNRFLRDDATKALVNLLKERPNVLISLLDKFNNVNDPYVAERLYGVAYGCVLINNNQCAIKKIAEKIYELVFANNNAPVHFLLRDYARNCIERAIYMKIELNIVIENIRPPYYSNWVDAISDEEAKRYYIEKENNEKYTTEELAQCHLYNSIMGFEDFGRYIIGTNSNLTNWTNIQLKQKKEFLALKETLKAKEKEMLGFYEKMIQKMFLFKNASDYQKKQIGQDFIKRITKDISLVEKQLFELLTEGQKNIVKEYVTPYFFKVYDKDHNSFDLFIMQKLILKKVFEMGWTKECFGDFDYNINSYYNKGRETRKKERIGKKYQWIALYELLARLTDNFEYKVQFYNDKETICQGPWHDKLRRDIDPGILIRKQENLPLPQFIKIFDDDYFINKNISNKNWLENDNDFPVIENLIQITDNNGDTWLKLEGFFNWKEETPFDTEEYSQPQKSIWLQIRSYLVSKSKKKVFFEWAKQQDYMGNWMPAASDRIEYFLRESYWAPSYKYIKQPYYGYEESSNPSFEKTSGKVSAKIIVTTENLLKESASYDCSMDESLFIILPCELIVNKMQLSFGEREGYLYDLNGKLVAFDPSVWDNGKSSLLIEKEKFLDFLKENNLDIVFTVLGGKQIIGNSNVGKNIKDRLEISGAYALNNKSEIEGKYTRRLVE